MNASEMDVDATTTGGPTVYVPAVAAAAYATGDGYTMPQHEKYEHYLCAFMAFIHQRDVRYPKGTTFTRDQLLEIQPQHIYDWLGWKAFQKKPFSIENGDRPIHARASHLDQLKKGISYFMPHNSPHWIDGRGGNPTKHNMHRKLIEAVKLCEVRKEGSESKVKRALTMPEFEREIKMLRAHGELNEDYNYRVKYVAMALWQYHLIGQVDDVCHFGMANPKGHDMFPFALKTKVQWSKNVRDEQKCPDQILLGAQDP